MAQNIGQWIAASSVGSQSVASSVSGASTNSTARYVPPARVRELKVQQNALAIAELKHKIELLTLESEELEVRKARTLGPKLPKFDLPFFLKKSKMDFLQARFPRTTFRCTDDKAHDHPLAHTETMIATKKALRIAPAGSLVVDYYGSVSAMASFTAEQARSNNPKVGLPYIDLYSPKAFLRHRNIGQPMVNGRTRYVHVNEGIHNDLNIHANTLTHDGRVYAGSDVVWFFKHTLYYLSDDQIQDCLNVEGSMGLAVIHRHVLDSGSLFDGECTYAKIDGSVQQVNKLTGERYTHRDLSWLWDSKDKVKYNANGAFTWTFHMVTEETWIIEMVAVPPNLDERFTSRAKFLGPRTAGEELNAHDTTPSAYPHPALADLPDSSCKMVGGVPIISFTEDELPDCRVTSVELFEFLRVAAVGQPRGPDLMQSLFALARSHSLDSSEFPGKRNFQVKAEDLASHVVLAFVTGLKKEVRLLRAATAHSVWSKEHHALLDGVHLTSGGNESRLQGALLAARRVNAGRKSGDTFDAILNTIG